MKDENDILDELLEMLDKDGNVDDAERNRLMTKTLIEILRRLRKIERESFISLLKRNPVKVSIVSMAVFVVMHEISSFIGIKTILMTTARILGVPLQ